MDLENFPTSESARRMMDRITKGFYEKSYVGKWIFQVMGMEWDEVATWVGELPYQAFLKSATWGIRYFEGKYGLEVNEGLELEDRRRIIEEKISKYGSMNPETLREISEKVTGRPCKVEDFVRDYTFWITVFQGKDGYSFKKFLEKIDSSKPSHMSYGVTLDFKETIALAYACVIRERKKIRESAYTGGDPLEGVTWYVDENEIILADEGGNILVE